MRSFVRHRYALLIPFALLGLVTLVGGALNTVDARGRVVDDSTDEPVAGVPITFGARTVTSGADGSYLFPALPRGARLSAQRSGYTRSTVSAEATELRLVPQTLTLQVNEEGTDPPKGVPFPEARQRQRSIGRGSETGSVIVGPYPERNILVLVCAEGFEPKDISARGVRMDVALRRLAGGACPPLPSPSPVPPAQTASPTPPIASPTPPRSP